MSVASPLGIPTGAAARDVGVSATYIRRLIERGELVVTRTPLGDLIDPASLEAFKQRREARKVARNA